MTSLILVPAHFVAFGVSARFVASLSRKGRRPFSRINQPNLPNEQTIARFVVSAATDPAQGPTLKPSPARLVASMRGRFADSHVPTAHGFTARRDTSSPFGRIFVSQSPWFRPVSLIPPPVLSQYSAHLVVANRPFCRLLHT